MHQRMNFIVGSMSFGEIGDQAQPSSSDRPDRCCRISRQGISPQPATHRQIPHINQQIAGNCSFVSAGLPVVETLLPATDPNSLSVVSTDATATSTASRPCFS